MSDRTQELEIRNIISEIKTKPEGTKDRMNTIDNALRETEEIFSKQKEMKTI